MNNMIPDIHHVTAIASDPQRNLDFYTNVLGLRMVKLPPWLEPMRAEIETILLALRIPLEASGD